MFTAFREALHRNDYPATAQGWDPDGILAPTGVDTGGDAGALALPAFYRGVAIKAGMIASIPLRWEVNGRYQPIESSPPLVAQPDPSELVAVTVKRMVSSLVMHGNAIAVLGGWDDMAFPNAMRLVHPKDISVRVEQGRISYRIAGTDYPAAEVLHLRGLTLPGSVLGVSPIEAMRRNLEGARAVESYGRTYFVANGVPTAHIKVNRPRDQVNEQELKALARKWMALLAGGRRPVWTAADIDITPFQLSNDDSQFLETRQFNLGDIANIVGIPGYFIGAPGSSRTYSNVQDERRALVDIYLREEMEAVEDGITALLPAGRAKFDPTSFLRLDPLATVQALAIETGWLTINEIREVQGFDPIDGGDVVAARYQPQALPAGGAQQ